MKISSSILVLSLLSPLLFQLSQSSTILVDGVSEWKNPIVHIGDSVIFKHKYHYNLYIFQNLRAFILCNFTQSTLLNKPDSTYTWNPSRLGMFYFTFNNGSLKSCEGSEKLAIKVSALPIPSEAPPPQGPAVAPEIPPMAAPVSGGVVSSSPAYPWPFQPHQGQVGSPAQSESSSGNGEVPMPMPSLMPDDKGGGNGMPFINSNPAVPLPTGEVDSATFRPLSTSSHHLQLKVGLLAVKVALFSSAFLML